MECWGDLGSDTYPSFHARPWKAQAVRHTERAYVGGGRSSESVRAWVRQAGGSGSTATGRIATGVGFLRGGARPPTQMMVAFIDTCREDFGVEPICAQLPIDPSSYYDAKSRPVSARARRHAAMTVVLVALWAANYRVYGARKLWLAERLAGHEIGRDQVAALMRAAGICGVTRRRLARTTVRDPGAQRPGDLVNRDFTARSPNRLWVTDLTVAPSRTGAAYVCFIVDAFSRLIVGWRVAAHMRTEMVLDAVEMARRG